MDASEGYVKGGARGDSERTERRWQGANSPIAEKSVMGMGHSDKSNEAASAEQVWQNWQMEHLFAL
jgi:hypothetical protein